MKRVHAPILIVLGIATPLACGQKAPGNPPPKPMETTVCKILDDPSAYNNRPVKVRGYVSASSEYSLLVDERCDSDPMWLAFADGPVAPQLVASVNGSGAADGNSKRRQVPPMPIHLIRDANYTALMRFLAISAKGEACADGAPPAIPPDCTAYRVTATFTGRVGGVSKKIHEAHRKQSSSDQIAGKGFGHMGMFDAQIVVQSVENVIAIDESEIRKPLSKPQ
jgi:hypothetical protein